MKNTLLLIPVIAILTACGTTDRHAKIADDVRERETRSREMVLDKAPDWMIKLPESKNAVYSSGTASAKNYEMALKIASQHAKDKICMTASGTVSTRMKTYNTESVTLSESVSRSSCKEVDTTGALVEKQKIINTQFGYQAYVLVALPTGDANILKRAKEQQKLQELALKRSQEEDKKLD